MTVRCTGGRRIRSTCGCYEDPSADLARLPSTEDGLSTIRLIEAAVASHDGGTAVNLPNISGTTTQGPGQTS